MKAEPAAASPGAAIPFNVPTVLGTEQAYLAEAVGTGHLGGNGTFTRRVGQWLERHGGARRALLTPSCTAALEMAALLLEIQPGDEVIMPSFTFVSTANAFVLRGARVVFVDIEPGTMNVDPQAIEAAVGERTRAIVVVHYAGVSCAMDRILEIAERHRLWVVEDAAQAVGATWRGRALGTIGHLGAYSFHETKNVQCGEGGALLINDPRFAERAEIVREKGTNRSQFLRGQVDKYTWVDVGSSYLASELQAAFLLAQLEGVERITQRRLALWNRYRDALAGAAAELPHVPEGCGHNGHLFYLKLRDAAQRDGFIQALRTRGIQAVFHYIPLHSAPAGRRHGEFRGSDRHTSAAGARLVRLPLYYAMDDATCDAVAAAARECLHAR